MTRALNLSAVCFGYKVTLAAYGGIELQTSEPWEEICSLSPCLMKFIMHLSIVLNPINTDDFIIAQVAIIRTLAKKKKL